MLKETEEYSTKLFDYPLYNCNFEDYNIVSNWRRQHVSMAPLFASSLSSQDSASMNVMNLNVLRATVTTMEFQPTQMAPSKQFSSTSLMFSLRDEEQGSGAIFKDPNVVLRERSIRSRRFLKDKSKVSRHFAYLEVNKSSKQEELRKERIQRSEKNVNLCRKYRIGEYPDIEITLSSVIDPLQKLVLCDATLARHLYTSLFTSLMTKRKEAKMENTEFIEKVKENINKVLNTSTEFSSNTIGAFLDIALTYKNEMKFDPNAIANVCQGSGLFSIGCLLLEEYLEMQDDVPAPSKKRRGYEDANTNSWVKLAELYKEMNEWDVVTAVFMEKMNCSEIVLKAIEAESSGRWRAAQEFYADVIQNDTSSERKDFYYESYFKCFAALGEWDKLTDAIDQNVFTNENDNVWNLLWENDWNQRKLLPWYITASLRNTLSGINQNMFASINQYLQDPKKSEYLKSNFGEELAMLCLLQNDCDTANYYLNDTMTSWLENWAHINPLFLKLRADTLLNLKGVVDIHLFIKFINELTAEDCKSKTNALIKLWTESGANSMESLLQSETFTVYRNQFINVVQQKLLSMLPEDEGVCVKKELNMHKFKLYINLIEHALEQENYYVARKYVKLAPKVKDLGRFENLQWSLALSRILYFLSQTRVNDEEKIHHLLDSWKRIGISDNDGVVNDNLLCYTIKTKQHVFELTQKIHAILLTNAELYTGKLKELKTCMGNASLYSVDQIWEYGVNELKNALVYCQNDIETMMNPDNLQVYSHMAEAYVKLAYCTQNKDNLEETFIVCVLRAMKLGSSEGIQLFPCLLSRNLYQFRNTFKLVSAEVPTWMFLKWIPQLLANLDTKCIFAIDEIVLEIAKKYPQAIMFPYKISREKYTFESGIIEVLGKSLLEKLNDLLLSGELVENFLKAVSSVTAPVNVLMYHFKKLCACGTEQEFRNLLQKLLDDVFPESEKYIGYNDPRSIKGVVFKGIASYENKLKDLLKGKFDLPLVKDKIAKMGKEFSTKSKRSCRLIDYSPWLANFQASELRENLEIPGQYTGEKRPLVQYHTKIIGFAPLVLPLQSLRAPIRITILGNDAKEYNYLVKFGEDLRQDQRIEQLFILMNNVLLQDNNCNKRQMSISTYQVIPLNSNLGIIEWLNNTTELQAFIKDGLNDESVIEKSLYMYNTWISKVLSKKIKNPTDPERYCCAAIKYKDNDFICKYTELVNFVEADVLRKSFRKISINSESFFALRHKFIVSYAVVCISQWLLGIGDRNLRNTLISLQNGEAVGIDFGYAFGAGTQIIPIPELVPFRLTPHILNLMQPLNENGLLQETMIHCVRAFRKRSDILLATMDVFIQEPSIDWLEFGSRSEITSRNAIKKSWYPKQKIEHAKRKFQGVNPVKIIVEELRAGHSHNSQLRDIYINAVEGKANNFRTTVDDSLSEENQVKCLLDLATDYNLLGRMFEGWLSWI